MLARSFDYCDGFSFEDMIQVQLACLVVALIEKEEGKISTSVGVG